MLHLVALCSASMRGLVATSVAHRVDIHGEPLHTRCSVVDEVVTRLRGGSTKCDVVLVGCGVPKRGMGWYHGKQMLEGDVPSAQMLAVVEPWFLGPGADSPPGKVFGEWATDMEATYGTKFVKDICELDIQVRRDLGTIVCHLGAHWTCSNMLTLICFPDRSCCAGPVLGIDLGPNR